MKPALQLKLSQHLALTPQLQQSIKLLQLSTVEMQQELERYRKFAAAGLSDLALRLFDEPMDGLKLIAEHVVPAFERA